MDSFFHRLSNAYKYLNADQGVISHMTLAKLFSFVRKDSKSSRGSVSASETDSLKTKESVVSFATLLERSLLSSSIITSETHIATWDFLTQSMWSSILDACIDQMVLLYNVYKPYVDAVEPKPLQYVSLKNRFESDLSYQLAEYRIDGDYTDYHKLQKEMLMLLRVLKLLHSEIKESGIFIGVQDFVSTAIMIHKNEKKLISDTETKKDYYDYIRRLRVHEKFKGILETKHLHDTFIERQCAILDQIELMKAELAFVKRHQGAREEQNRLMLDGMERIHTSTIEEMDLHMRMENLCHSDISNYLLEAKDDYLREIDEWMVQYDKEMEQRTLDLLNKRIDIENMISKREKLQKLFDDRGTEMSDWLEYKRKKKEEEERIQRENRAATKIQAWWRGVMYRKKFGPYRKKKKGGKNKKGNKENAMVKKGSKKTPKKKTNG